MNFAVDFHPPAANALWESVLKYLRLEIFKGLPAGTQLVESELATRMGVSRGPIRDAFVRLEDEGLIVRQPRKGAYVLGVTNDDVREIYGLRQLLEGYAAKLNQARLNDNDLALMTECLRRMVKLRELEDWDASAEEDITFHRVPVVATGNRRLLRSWDALSGSIHSLISITIPRCPDLVMGTRQEHQPIIDAYRTGDVQKVKTVIGDSMASAERMMHEYMQARSAFQHE